MRVLKQDYLNHILTCHHRVKSISNVICEQINIDVGLVPLFLAACYDMSIRLQKSRFEERLIVHDVRYANEDKSKGFVIDHSIFSHGEKSNDGYENTLHLFEMRSKQYCIICGEDVPEAEGKCVIHYNIPCTDIDYIKDSVPELELALYKFIDELDRQHASEL